MPAFKKFLGNNPTNRSIALVAILAVIVAGVWYGVQRKISLSPENDFTAGGITLKVRSSDHSGSATLLPNNLTDQTVPNYGADTPELLPKAGNGDVSHLFRIQGEIDYK